MSTKNARVIIAEETKKKYDIDAPCIYTKKSVSRTTGDEITETYVPSVDCDFQCDSCGWNPKEKSRRIEDGWFRMIDSYIGPNGNCIELGETPVKQLSFIRKRA